MKNDVEKEEEEGFTEENIQKFFLKLTDQKIKIKDNNLYNDIQAETERMFTYLEEKVKKYPELFDKNFSTMKETMKYLKSISAPNNRVCAETIENGWHCDDCSDDSSSYYCSKCYFNFKDFHKGHKVSFVVSPGFCDCGDLNEVDNFCPEHKGPFTEQSQIDEYIEKSIPNDILSKLKIFFDDLFLQFSQYFILGEQCDFFTPEALIYNISEKEERKDINILEENFCIVFQNLLTFLSLVTYECPGMFYLISNYLLKNHFSSENIEEKHKTTHECIKVVNKKIEILYKSKNKNNNFFSLNIENEKHKCECPFLRLFLINWRNKVKPHEDMEGHNNEFLTSFGKNLMFKENFVAINYFLLKELMLNDNEEVLSARSNFFSEDNIKLVSAPINLLEEGYHFLYEYIKEIFIKIENEKENVLLQYMISLVLHKFIIASNEFKCFTKAQYIKIIYSNNNLVKEFIDIASLFHNCFGFKSIVPHPEFQNKKAFQDVFNSELYIVLINGIIFLNLCNDFENNFDKIKEIFDYFVKKILNQKSEGIKQLEENEFSFHLTLYRIFSIFINMLIMTYSLKNNKNIIDSIEYFKNNLFKSKEEMQKLIDIIIFDYLKFFGFISGVGNEFFNYYEDLGSYTNFYYKNERLLKFDFILLKYLFAMSDKKLTLDYILRASNIENTYSFFNSIIKSENANNLEKRDENDQYKDIMQVVRVLEIIITIIKNDSVHMWGLLFFYQLINSGRMQSSLYDNLKKNDKITKDLENMLKEDLVQIFLNHGNSVDMFAVMESTRFFEKVLGKKKCDEILNDLSDSKKEKGQFFVNYTLKDSGLNYFDLNYYYSPATRSAAQKYITEFKKDKVKLYKSYYFKVSNISFDFLNKIYGSIFLNVENIEFLIKIIEVLFSKENSEIIKKVKNTLSPIILNYLTMFGSINSKSFIKFKIENKNLIDKIIDILNKAIENNKDNLLLDKDLSDNVNNLKEHINRYKIINDDIRGDLNKLNDFDYNIEYKLFEDTQSNKEENKNVENEKGQKMKDKLKDKMKEKQDNFIEKIQGNKDMNDIILKEENKENEDGKLICLHCNNQIDLNSFEEPYGRIGLLNDDFFFKNCFRLSVKSELDKIIEKDTEEKNNINSELMINDEANDLLPRLNYSCGHYFHEKCFKQCLEQKGIFICEVCKDNGNILIPPMIYFYGKNKYLNSEKLEDILDKKKEIKNPEIKEEENNNLKNFIIHFIYSKLLKLSNEEKIEDYDSIIDKLFFYQSFINHLGNMFLWDARNYFKIKQINNIQNIILSLRYLIKINEIDINQIIKYIRNGFENLVKEFNENDNIIEKYKEMYFSNYIEKILFSCVLLLDYNEIQKLFLYIINISLPYFSFWLYLRNLIAENNFYSLYDEKSKEKISYDNFKKYINDNNKQMNDYLKLYLQKLLVIKLTTKYDIKIEDLDNINFNSLSIEQLFNELNLENLYKILNKNENEINFIDLLEKSTKIFSSDSSLITQNCMISGFGPILNSLINNLKKQKEEKYLMDAELFSQFILYKYEPVKLDENLFDFIEKNIFKKCDICNKSTSSMICLTCGKKFCFYQRECIIQHFDKCMREINISICNQSFHFIGIKNIYVKNNDNNNNTLKKSVGRKKFIPLYTNKFGEETGVHILNEFTLNKENLEKAIKDFICFNYN